MGIALVGLSTCALALAKPAEGPWKLLFWIDGKVEGVSENDVIGHPCGAVVELSVSAIPLNRPNIDTDRVIEFDMSGATIREWRAPVDSLPVAVDGNRLIIKYSREHSGGHLAILPLGKIEAYSMHSIDTPLPASAEMQCPATLVTLFGKNDYLFCQRWKDRSTGARRNIAFEGICT